MVWPDSGLHSCRLYYFNLHDDYPHPWTLRSIYKAALPFLVDSSENWCIESNILTTDDKLVLEIQVDLLFTHCRIPISI